MSFFVLLCEPKEACVVDRDAVALTLSPHVDEGAADKGRSLGAMTTHLPFSLCANTLFAARTAGAMLRLYAMSCVLARRKTPSGGERSPL